MRVLTAGPPVLVAWPAPVRRWAREEPGHRGTSALQSLRLRPCPTKAAIMLMSRDSVAWRHCAGWGHRFRTQKQKLAASGLVLRPDSRGDCPKAVPLSHRELVSSCRCGGSPGLRRSEQTVHEVSDCPLSVCGSCHCLGPPGSGRKCSRDPSKCTMRPTPERCSCAAFYPVHGPRLLGETAQGAFPPRRLHHTGYYFPHS